MSRPYLDYSARREPVLAEGFNPDVPVAGYYRTRLRSGAVRVGVRIWFGPPNDPVTGEVMDRSWRWQAQVNGTYIDIEDVWPKCAADPIDEAEYRHLCNLGDWAETNAPAIADPFKRIDPLTSPLLF